MPKSVKNAKRIGMSFAATAKEAKAVRHLAKQQGLTISNLLRDALLKVYPDYFSEKKLENAQFIRKRKTDLV